MKYAVKYFLILCLILSASYAQAESISIDLGSFYADPTAVVRTDGLSATLTEDPVMGDPGIEIPSGLSALQFSYDFSIAESDPYYFFAKAFATDPRFGKQPGQFLCESLRRDHGGRHKKHFH